MNSPHIELAHVSFSYAPSDPILQDITFAAQGGESIGLIGANGVGKSTLLKLLVGLNLADAGSIFIEGVPVTPQTLPQIRQKIGYVFQDSDSQLFMPRVYDDVAFAPRNYGFSEAEVRECVERALAMAHIEHLKEKQIYKLSGGEKKLASIATILAITPAVLLMDEPSIALDPRNRRNLIRILNGFGHLKIIASHDLDFILDTCSRVILLHGGKIIRDGGAREILSDRELLESHGLELPLCMQGQA